VVAVEAIGLLHEPVRRAVYEYTVAQAEPVGRDDVAAGVGIGRPLAAFHLDKLAAAGLLAVSYARRTGRTGPGSGRPAKLYRRAPGEVSVSVPPREYGTLAAILAEAAEIVGADAAAHEAAYRYGVRRGKEAAATAAETTGGGDVVALLGALGYEPVPDGAEVRLRNCPYGAVAHAFPPLVCGANLSLVRGLLAGLGLPEDTAGLAPRRDGCCVALHPPVHPSP
jgi:predicted ArsR family transcriptional regulator